MKKLLILLIAMLVPAMILAQTKKRPVAKNAAAKKPAAKVNNNFAVLEFDEWINHNHPFEDEENIYFLGNGNSPNVLRAVNKQTGEVKIVVPPKKRARTMICCAGSDGKNVYMRLENKGIALFNGIDVNTSEIVVPQSEQYKGFLIYGNRGYNIIGSPNGRYIMLYGDNPIVYDKEEGRVVRYGSSGSTFPVLTDDGMVIDYDYKGLFSQVKGNPVLDYTSPKNNVDRKYFDFKGVDNGANGDVCSIWYDIPDNMVYIAKGEQILKSPVQPDLDFKEVYCLPGENKEFRLVAFNGSRVFAVTDNYQKKFYEWDNKDMTGEPKISQSIDTGVTFTSTSGLTRKYVISDAKRLYYDKAGNLWVQVADGRFIIYNPDGIKGLTALKGKYTENKLPKEED
jgi:hypothetical protein